MKVHQKFILFLLSILFATCQVMAPLPDAAISRSDYQDIVVFKKNLCFYTNLGSSSTRSEDSGSLSLESLLDRDASETIVFKNFQITQIPFKCNDSEPNVALTSERLISIPADSLTIVRKYVIETVDTLTGAIQLNVAAMIPETDNFRTFGGDSFSFLDKSTFRGYVIYSELDGTYADVYKYGHGPIQGMRLIPADNITDSSEMIYLSVPQIMETKGGAEKDSQETILDPSYCIADRDNSNIDLGEEEDEDGSGHSITPPVSSGGGGGGGGLIGGQFTDGRDDSSDLDRFTYQIALYSADGGYTMGSGQYSLGNVAICKAIPSEDSFVFDRWTGDFKNKAAEVVITVDKDIESTAYFANPLEVVKRPCWDKETGKANPLVEMELAPTDKADKQILGATFGMTRFSRTRKHSGLDLYAEPGTPIYSMFDGVVALPYVTEQPTKTDQEYPADYMGDKNNAGNRIYIQSSVNGEKIAVGYWHLMEGTPVAINPRTGRPFKVGDTVYQGELIAYTGITGNAYNVPNPHLHLSVKNGSGVFVDPEDYINGKVSASQVNGLRTVNSTDIKGINCDDEEKELTIYY